MRKFFFAALAAMVMFASCDKDNNEGIDPNDAKSVRVQITQAPSIRAVSDEVPDDHPAVLNGGVFVFSDGTNILKTVNVPGDLTVQNAIDGHTIANVPNTVTRVHFFGNVPSGVTIPASGTLASAKAKMITVASQADNLVKVDRVSLFGETPADIDDTAPADGILDAEFEIAPIAARVEIEKLTAGGVITGYKIEGIFINNYYVEQAVDGTIGTGVIENNGSDVTIYVGTYNAALHDYWTTPTSLGTTTDDVTYTAGTNKVWAYNVLAPSDALDDKSAVPHIVIRLSSITTSAGGPDFSGTTQYLTVKGYKNGGADVTKFQGGYSYLLEDIAFDEDDLKPQPEIEPISVNVKITAIPWNQVVVTPVF